MNFNKEDLKMLKLEQLVVGDRYNIKGGIFHDSIGDEGVPCVCISIEDDVIFGDGDTAIKFLLDTPIGHIKEQFCLDYQINWDNDYNAIIEPI